MQVYTQSLDELMKKLSPLEVDWMDKTAENVIAMLTAIPQKTTYVREDIGDLLDKNFDEGILACRLFLGLSKDNMEAALKKQLEPGGSGVTRFKCPFENVARGRIGVVSRPHEADVDQRAS